jgi:hypothetical protein
MPKRSRFLALLLSLAFFPAFPTASNLHAQATTAPSVPSAHNNAADPDNEPVASLFVSIRLDESAHVSVNANLFVPQDKQPGVASIKSALEATLYCRLTDDPLLHTTYKAAQGFYLGSASFRAPHRSSSTREACASLPFSTSVATPTSSYWAPTSFFRAPTRLKLSLLQPASPPR